MASSLFDCPPPFLNKADYPYTGGREHPPMLGHDQSLIIRIEESNRFCSPISQNTTCCLPCPVTDWVYPDNFTTVYLASSWLGMCSFVCCAVLLLSFLVLPVRKTSRHYLTVCLIAAVACMTFSFVVSLGAHPQQCHDPITPNDMQSDLACAFSGSFVIFGGMSAAMWVFIRSLSLHLQICWQIVPGKKFFYAAMLGGWGIPVLLVSLSLVLSGVSYRFGPICHVNHDYSIGTFWGPILGFTGLAAACQFATLGYCIRVYLRSLLDSSTTATTSTAASGALPSVNGSFKAMSAKAAYRRVRKVIALQWRGVMVVVILITTATYFSAVFLKMDNASVSTQQDPESALPWLTCLYLSGGNKNQCLPQVGNLILSEPFVATCLYLLGCMGFWCVLFLGRWSMVGAWWELISSPFRSDSDNWVSADARRMSDPRNYEMLTAPPQQLFMAKGPSGLVATASVVHTEQPKSGHSGVPKAVQRAAARDFSPSSRDPCLADDNELTIERTLSKSSLQQRPTRSASQNTARVTFSRDTPTPIQASPFSPRSPSSNEYYTPRTYASPTTSNNRDYFSSPRANARAEMERSNSINRPRGNSAQRRDWYGHDASAPRPSTRDGDAEGRSVGGGALRDWDPQSTFARGNSLRQLNRKEGGEF